MIEKIPIKFHVEDHQLIFDDVLIILANDKLKIEHYLDKEGKMHYTRVWIERRVRSMFGDN